MIVALAAALLGSLGSGSLQGQGAALKPPVVALINAQKVINQLDERKKLEADLQALIEKNQKESQERHSKVLEGFTEEGPQKNHCMFRLVIREQHATVTRALGGGRLSWLQKNR